MRGVHFRGRMRFGKHVCKMREENQSFPRGITKTHLRRERERESAAMAFANDEEDDDYMGDLARFLQPNELALSNSSPIDTASHNIVKVVKGKLSWQERKKQKREEQQHVEDGHLSQGLNAAISSTNIGFKMLQQMGYTPGHALGKNGQGKLEPINLDVKRNRTGLGRDSIVKAEKEEKERKIVVQLERKRKKHEELKSSFQERRRSSWQNRRIVSNYHKACTALSQLEDASGCSEREFSLNSKRTEEEGRLEKDPNFTGIEDQNEQGAKENLEDDAEEEITPEVLQEVLEKLRSNYFYCLYCGCQYESAESLLANCPGLEEDDH